jgi:hypothetical protein
VPLAGPCLDAFGCADSTTGGTKLSASVAGGAFLGWPGASGVPS